MQDVNKKKKNNNNTKEILHFKPLSKIIDNDDGIADSRCDEDFMWALYT